MTTRRLGAIDAADDAALAQLIHAYPFKPYRNYRVLSRRLQEAVMRAEIQEALAQPSAGAIVVSGETDAAVVFQPLPWDSAFFDISMGRILYILRGEDAQRNDIEAAVTACLDACRASGIRHLMARVDVADTDGIGALEDHGFRLMDALVTYIYHPKREPPPVVKEMGVLRPFREEDASQVVEITREAYKGFRSRFYVDPHLPADRCDELYVEWARRACTKEMAREMLVTENGRGELHGFLSFRRIEPVSTVGGVEMYGRGLGACRRERPGAYAGLIRAGTAWTHARGAVSETQTQNYNYSTVRVYEAVGTQYVRAEYTLHAWLG